MLSGILATIHKCYIAIFNTRLNSIFIIDEMKISDMNRGWCHQTISWPCYNEHMQTCFLNHTWKENCSGQWCKVTKADIMRQSSTDVASSEASKYKMFKVGW